VTRLVVARARIVLLFMNIELVEKILMDMVVDSQDFMVAREIPIIRSALIGDKCERRSGKLERLLQFLERRTWMEDTEFS